MVSAIAFLLASITEQVCPFIPPFIGAFVTGNDMSANIVFGGLQKQVTLEIGKDPIWIRATKATGAIAGKMISPQSIVVATPATSLAKSERNIFNSTLPYCLIYAILLGMGVFLLGL